jgi:hypothetical protein
VVLTENRLAPARLRDHQAYHQGQGWADLAYHFAIDRDGNVYEARPYSAPGDTFTNYDPAGHFLPVLEGDYREQEPTDRQLESWVLLSSVPIRPRSAATVTTRRLPAGRQSVRLDRRWIH